MDEQVKALNKIAYEMRTANLIEMSKHLKEIGSNPEVLQQVVEQIAARVLGEE